MIRTIVYWLFTVLLVFPYAGGAYFDYVQPDEIRPDLERLGYPLFFFKILAVWKGLAVIALLAPGLPRLKEWTYAGIVFNLTGAAATHVFLNHAISDIITPLVILVFAAISYFTRPASRKLAGPLL